MGEVTKHQMIRNALGLPYRAYDNYRQCCFQNWCDYWSRQQALPLRPMVLNRSLHSWYCTQWLHQVEEAFYEDCKDYIDAGIDAHLRYRDLFESYTHRIEACYPAPLLKMIRREWKTKAL